MNEPLNLESTRAKALLAATFNPDAAVLLEGGHFVNAKYLTLAGGAS